MEGDVSPLLHLGGRVRKRECVYVCVTCLDEGVTFVEKIGGYFFWIGKVGIIIIIIIIIIINQLAC